MVLVFGGSPHTYERTVSFSASYKDKICSVDNIDSVDLGQPVCLRWYRSAVDSVDGFHKILNACEENVELPRVV